MLSLGRARAFGRVESAARGSYDLGSAESGPRKYTRVAWPDLLSIMRTRRACRATMYTACRTRTELLACTSGDTMARLFRGCIRCKFDQMQIPAAFLSVVNRSGLETCGIKTGAHLIAWIHIWVLHKGLILTASIGRQVARFCATTQSCGWRFFAGIHVAGRGWMLRATREAQHARRFKARIR